MGAGATILGVARTFGVHASQVFRWRQQLCGKAAAAPGFAAVAIAAEPREAALGRGGSIEIELGPEVRIRDQRRGRCGNSIGGARGAQGGLTMTIPLPSGTQVWLATGHTDMRKGFDGLALLVQETLKRDPHGGHLFVFRGRSGGLIKVLWHDGQGMCLFAKRLERAASSGRRLRTQRWRSRRRSLGYLLEGIDWRHAQRTWRPQAAG